MTAPFDYETIERAHTNHEFGVMVADLDPAKCVVCEKPATDSLRHDGTCPMLIEIICADHAKASRKHIARAKRASLIIECVHCHVSITPDAWHVEPLDGAA